jgi:carbamoyl-phosphate synthase large subunit
MGIDTTFGRAFFKAEIAAGTDLPRGGMVFLSLADRDKAAGLVVAQRLRELGLGIAATRGTAAFLERFGLPVDRVVEKVSDGIGVTAVDLMASGEITFVINTPQGSGPRADGRSIRQAAAEHRISAVTTVEAALAAAQGLSELAPDDLTVRSLQEHHVR